MTRAETRAFRPTDARRVDEILRRLVALWQAPALADIPVVLNPRLSRTLGRLVGRPWRIELGPRALASSKRLQEVVMHEGVLCRARDEGRPHPPSSPRTRMARADGPRRLPASDGRPQALPQPAGQSPQQTQQPKPRTRPAIAYDHWCPVCQSSRQVRRPVKAWRCAACVAAGLDGKLEITRRARRPAATP